MRNIARSLRAEAPFFEHIRSQSIKTITLNNKGNDTDKKQRIRGSCLKSNLPFLQPLQNLPILWSYLMLIATTQTVMSKSLCWAFSHLTLLSENSTPIFQPLRPEPHGFFPFTPSAESSSFTRLDIFIRRSGCFPPQRTRFGD